LYFNFFVNAEDCFIETQIEHYLLIFPWRRSRGSPSSATSKWVSPEKVLEDVVKVEVEWVTSHSAAAEAIVTELVIPGSRFVIRQDCVGLADFFEFGFGCFVVGVRVRVIFAGKFAIGAFEFFDRCAAIDS
jgi:hypothetical protein